MAESIDALVIGGGLAGVTAALRLRHQGWQVALSAGAPGHSATFSGVYRLAQSMALLRQRPAAPLTVEAHLDDIVWHVPSHPFARLGRAQAHRLLGEGWRGVAAAVPASHPWPAPALPAALSFVPTDSGVLVAGHVAPSGASWPTVARPASIIAVDLGDWGAPLDGRAVLGWQHDADRQGLPAFDIGTVRPPAPASLPAWAAGHAAGLARWLEGEGHLDALVHALSAAVPPEATEVWLPAVLGLEQHAAVVDELRRQLGRPCREVASAAGVVPGLRRQGVLAAALERTGVHTVARAESLACDARASRARLADGTELVARGVVLATGRFLGGGLSWPSQQRCRESLLGLSLVADDRPATERSPMELTASLPRAPQAIELIGLATDGAGRPHASGPQGPLPGTVVAAGGLLGGWQERLWPSGDGVALATGAAAAETLLHARSTASARSAPV